MIINFQYSKLPGYQRYKTLNDVNRLIMVISSPFVELNDFPKKILIQNNPGTFIKEALKFLLKTLIFYAYEAGLETINSAIWRCSYKINLANQSNIKTEVLEWLRKLGYRKPF